MIPKLDCDEEDILKLGSDYSPPPGGLSKSKYLDELRQVVKWKGRSLTNQYGRAYILEFFWPPESNERSFAVEISAVLPIALLEFVERRKVGDSWELTESDVGPTEETEATRREVEKYLTGIGITVISSADQDRLINGRSLRDLLIYNKDD